LAFAFFECYILVELLPFDKIPHMYGELEEVLTYIPQKIDEYGLVALYRELAALYDKARNEPSSEVTNQMQDLLKRIDVDQNKIEPNDWGLIKLKIFENTGAPNLIGKKGFQNLKDEISSLTNDPNGVKEILMKYATGIEELRNRMEQALNNLSPLFVSKNVVPESMRKIELVFENKVSVEDFGNLVDQSREWNLIIKNLKIMTGASDGDVKIYSISKSSPLVIVIFGVPVTIWVLAKIVKEVLDIIEKLMTIKKIKLEIKAAQLDIELKATTISSFEIAEEKKLNELIEEKIEIIMVKIGKNLPLQQLNEAKNAARYSIKKVYNFTVSGGSVNLIDKVKDNENETYSQAQFFPVYQKTKELLETSKEPLLLAKFSPSEKSSANKRVKNVEESKEKTENKLKKMVEKVAKKGELKSKVEKRGSKRETRAVVAKEIKGERIELSSDAPHAPILPVNYTPNHMRGVLIGQAPLTGELHPVSSHFTIFSSLHFI
ncbi:MAG: hypothetical protein NTZ07_04320, partial [Candidatus Woesebacteria bacterium]|nr:hypothetical protein [Candidatus Woesebacteria bacterium]